MLKRPKRKLCNAKKALKRNRQKETDRDNADFVARAPKEKVEKLQVELKDLEIN